MKKKLNVGRAFFALALVVVLTNSFTTTAQADEERDHDDWRRHERDAREWHNRHMRHHNQSTIVEQQPNIVYAPPVIVEAPQASADTGSSGFNITIPINFR